MKIIAIAGKAESGKDTFANFTKQHLESKGKKVLILHNADYLKFICSQYLGWDGQKNDEGRKLLQEFGTDYVREQYDESYWVKSVVRVIELLQDRFEYFLVPDSRFRDEFEVLRKNFEEDKPDNEVISVRIVRPNHKSKLTQEQLNHRSETELDDYTFDYQMILDEGLKYPESRARVFVNKIL
jgi:hypothetical protein